MSRSDAFIHVTCDVCGDPDMTQEVGLCALARSGWDERNVEGELCRMGWRVEDGKDICPNCVADTEEDDE